MIQFFGQLVAPDAVAPDGAAEGAVAPPVGMRAMPAPARGEQQGRDRGLRRRLELRWRLALAIAVGFAALAVVYFLAEAYVLKAWPTYGAESVVRVQPAAGKDPPKGDAQPGAPFGSDTYEAYIQREMTGVSGQDVLASALHRLTGFRRVGESQQAAAQRLVRALEVTRPGPAYQFSISARAETAAMAAQIANAVAAASVESAKRDEQTGNAQRQQMWREERDGIQSALAADLAEQDALNKQIGVVAGGAGMSRLERLSELETEIKRLKGRAAAVDEQWLNLTLSDGAAGATYQVTPAEVPAERTKSGVLRNSALIGAAGLFFGVLAVVGFVLNRAGLKTEDGSFLASDEAVEEHLVAESSKAAGDAAGHAEELAAGQNSVSAESPSGRESLNSVTPAEPLPVATLDGNAVAPVPAMGGERAKLWTARRTSTDPAMQPVEVDFSAELKRLMSSGKQFSKPWPSLRGAGLHGSGLQGPGLKEAPLAEGNLAPRPERAPELGTEAAAEDQSARLDALRSLLLAMVAKNGSGGKGTTEHQDR